MISPAPGTPKVDGDAGAAPTDPPSVDASEFGWTYRSRKRPALDGLTFHLDPGRVLLVLGPSGSGKSTLARALAGLVPHVLPGSWRGQLSVGELDVAATPAARLGERVGLVFQDPDSQLVMSRVEDEVAFGLENRGWPIAQMRRAVPEALRGVGLAGFERRRTATLSGGEQQRLAIADVLAPAPSLLVFDEPTANLDPPGMYGTFERLAELVERREHTIVIVEHRLEAALPLADSVLILDDEGCQVAFGAPDEVGGAHAQTLDRLGGWVPSRWRGWASREEPTPVSAASAEARTLALSGRAPVLQADRITLRYPADASGPHPPALSDVGLALRPCERVALVGPNGSGKSSLLFVLAGLRKADGGRVAIGDGLRPPTDDPSRLPARRLAERVGLVFQDPELGFVGRTASEEVGASGTSSDDAALVGALLGRFGLGQLAGTDPFRLSQGEQRRLSLAAASLRPPRVLLLDEPTFGLDRRGSEAVVALLDELRDGGQAQLIATHDPRLTLVCDRVVALEGGRVVFDGPPARFLSDPPYRPPAPWRGLLGLTDEPVAARGEQPLRWPVAQPVRPTSADPAADSIPSASVHPSPDRPPS